MEGNDSLIIEQVMNGFTVKGEAMEHCPSEKGYVFQTYEELIDFLRNHFSHRTQDISCDT